MLEGKYFPSEHFFSIFFRVAQLSLLFFLHICFVPFPRPILLLILVLPETHVMAVASLLLLQLVMRATERGRGGVFSVYGTVSTQSLSWRGGDASAIAVWLRCCWNAPDAHQLDLSVGFSGT